MALSVVTAMGRVDLPPGFAGQSGQQADATAQVVEFTIQAADDTTGILNSTILAAMTAANVAVPSTFPGTALFTSILGVIVLGVRTAGGVPYVGIPVYDPVLAKTRFTVAFAGTEYTAVNGDIWRVLIIGV
jgi:hypothetical protein